MVMMRMMMTMEKILKMVIRVDDDDVDDDDNEDDVDNDDGNK